MTNAPFIISIVQSIISLLIIVVQSIKNLKKNRRKHKGG